MPMYLVGDDERHRRDATLLVERLIDEQERLATNAEVFQEILHRFTSIGRRDGVQPAFDTLRGIVDEVFPIEEADVVLAKDIAATHPRLSARDALHVAVMRRHGITRVLTFDRGFDVVAGIERIPA